jgi:hypothetical protein
MFLTSKYSGYNRAGEQSAGGRFLILACRTKPGEFQFGTDGSLYACVRYARLRQCGHFMMGSVRVGPKRLILSGNYGNDGLPEIDFKDSPELEPYCIPVPDDLAAAFWADDSYHVGGVTIQQRLREWALQAFPSS